MIETRNQFWNIVSKIKNGSLHHSISFFPEISIDVSCFPEHTRIKSILQGHVKRLHPDIIPHRLPIHESTFISFQKGGTCSHPLYCLWTPLWITPTSLMMQKTNPCLYADILRTMLPDDNLPKGGSCFSGLPHESMGGTRKEFRSFRLGIGSEEAVRTFIEQFPIISREIANTEL